MGVGIGGRKLAPPIFLFKGFCHILANYYIQLFT